MVKRKDFIVSDEGEAAETPSESEEEKPKKKPASKVNIRSLLSSLGSLPLSG